MLLIFNQIEYIYIFKYYLYKKELFIQKFEVLAILYDTMKTYPNLMCF